jgi:hypothetical protein
MQSFHYSNVRSRTTDSENKDPLRSLYSVVNQVPLPAVKSLIGLILAIIAAASTPVQWEDIKGWINNLKSEATIVRTFSTLFLGVFINNPRFIRQRSSQQYKPRSLLYPTRTTRLSSQLPPIHLDLWALCLTLSLLSLRYSRPPSCRLECPL